MGVQERLRSLSLGLLYVCSTGCVHQPATHERPDLIARVSGAGSSLDDVSSVAKSVDSSLVRASANSEKQAADLPETVEADSTDEAAGERKPALADDKQDLTSDRESESARSEQEAAAEALSEPLTLEKAREQAMRYSPILNQSRAAVDAALGNLQIVDSAFLPTFQGNYAYQAFSSNTGFVGTRGRFPVLPVRGFGPGAQDFHVAEVQMKWTIFQFGRLLSKQSQAEFKTEIAKLDLERTHQSVCHEVARTYFQVLEAKSALEIAERAVERAEAYQKEAGDLLRRGVITREESLRVDAGLAGVRQLRSDAKSEEEVAVAAFNQTMGINVNSPTRVAERKAAPRLDLSLKDTLEMSVANRREIPVVLRAIAIARGDVDIARADFLPSVSIQAGFSDVTGTGVQNSNVGAGGIFVTQDLYTGGKRRGQVRAAQAGLRSAEAQAQQVCDLIAFEVNAAYRGFEDARERIESARAVFQQSRENLRLVSNRYKAGEATPAEVVEARASDTKSEQTFASAFYQYQRALARLEYAVGGALPVSSEEIPTTVPGEGEAERLPAPPGTTSPFRSRAPFSVPGLPQAPDFGQPSPIRPQPLPIPTPIRPSPSEPGLFGPPSLSKPPYESTSPFGAKP